MAETRSRDLADVVGTGTSLPSATSIGAVSSTELGYLDGVTSALQTQIDSKLNLAGGKILQIVRATDSTQRDTTSSTNVDVTGMSVTITPQKSDSAVIVIATAFVITNSSNQDAILSLTDSSNNSLSGAQRVSVAATSGGLYDYFTAIGYATPATTSAVTYKLRFRVANGGTISLRNDLTTGQIYAIEVSA